MHTETRTTDAKGRVLLPHGFANATVLVELVGDTEVRIRKARVVPEDELPFREDFDTILSDEARDWFIQLLENPPVANTALKNLMSAESASHD